MVLSSPDAESNKATSTKRVVNLDDGIVAQASGDRTGRCHHDAIARSR